MAKPGPKPIPFWDRVDKTDECWEWTGCCFPNGYGCVSVDRVSTGTHRRAWELSFGAIPERMCVCHHCDNKRCVRPDHLFLGTLKENAEDMVAKGRSARGSRHANARLTEQAVVEIKRRYEAGGITQLALAKEYGVVEGAIWNVLHGYVWSHAA